MYLSSIKKTLSILNSCVLLMGCCSQVSPQKNIRDDELLVKSLDRYFKEIKIDDSHPAYSGSYAWKMSSSQEKLKDKIVLPDYRKININQ
jgi:hypothetical protein